MTGWNILIVDDSQTVREVLEKTLRLTQLPLEQCLHAGNGREALDLLGKNVVDLIFLDINMPEMNGLELVEHLSRDGVLRHIPVVVVSTESSRKRVDQLREAGIAEFVEKPFYPEQLCDVVNRVMEPTHAG
jgi:two-component system chemotaxis response regulator CheY